MHFSPLSAQRWRRKLKRPSCTFWAWPCGSQRPKTVSCAYSMGTNAILIAPINSFIGHLSLCRTRSPATGVCVEVRAFSFLRESSSPCLFYWHFFLVWQLSVFMSNSSIVSLLVHSSTLQLYVCLIAPYIFKINSCNSNSTWTVEQSLSLRSFSWFVSRGNECYCSDVTQREPWCGHFIWGRCLRKTTANPIIGQALFRYIAWIQVHSYSNLDHTSEDSLGNCIASIFQT